MTTYNFAKTENLSHFLAENIKFATTLCSSDKTKDILALEKVLTNLQHCRKYYPGAESDICDAIFKIYDKAYYSTSDFMRHRIRVMTLHNFAKMPTKNMSVLKELLNRIALVENLQEVFAMTQVITDRALEHYEAQKDPDLKVAERLKGLMLLLSQTPAIKNNRANRKWLSSCATYFESIQPACKELVKSLPKPGLKAKKNVPLILEACDVCPKVRCMRFSTYE